MQVWSAAVLFRYVLVTFEAGDHTLTVSFASLKISTIRIAPGKPQRAFAVFFPVLPVPAVFGAVRPRVHAMAVLVPLVEVTDVLFPVGALKGPWHSDSSDSSGCTNSDISRVQEQPPATGHGPRAPRCEYVAEGCALLHTSPVHFTTSVVACVTISTPRMYVGATCTRNMMDSVQAH